jgi:hypothetical protein
VSTIRLGGRRDLSVFDNVWFQTVRGPASAQEGIESCALVSKSRRALAVLRPAPMGAIMAAMADRDNQHYIPKMYLRPFIDPTLAARSAHHVWVYAAGAEPESRGVDRIGSASRFYDIPGAADVEVAEKSFSKMETVAARHLPKLRAGDISLTEQEKAEVAWFVGASMNRTPLAFDRTNAAMVGTFRLTVKDRMEDPAELQRLADEMTAEGNPTTAERIREICEEIVSGKQGLVQRDRGATINLMFRNIGYWGEWFRHMVWVLCEAPEGSLFVTTDSPVNVNDEGAMRQRFDEYTGPTRDVRFYYPISPKYALTGAFVPAKDQVSKVDADWVQKANTAMIVRAYKEVYASFRSAALRDELTKRHAERKPPIPPPDSLF